MSWVREVEAGETTLWQVPYEVNRLLRNRVIKTISFSLEHSAWCTAAYICGRKGRLAPVTLASFSVMKIRRMWTWWVVVNPWLWEVWELWGKWLLGGKVRDRDFVCLPVCACSGLANTPTACGPSWISGLLGVYFLNNFKSHQALVTSQLLESFFPQSFFHSYSGELGSLQSSSLSHLYRTSQHTDWTVSRWAGDSHIKEMKADPASP